ncbi:MAG: serine protease [Firmicutes bacterium HGW-Firmicutes-15]|nr:MAG: serine protease [Firmicutes bacterium HGW-Firmicutes-15]
MNEEIILNEIPGEEDLHEEDIEGKRHSGCLMKIVALLILMAFIAFSVPNFSYLFSNKLNFLDQNKSLMEDAIVQKCKPAVVNIEVTDINEPLNTVVRHGTGFNISPTGIIVTNQHVVYHAGTITITFGDGRRYYSREYDDIPGVDVAIIRLAANNLPTISLDFKDQVQTGDTVTIIGNPLGFDKISQRGKVGEYHKIADSQSLVFDVKLPVNPGNSGSPVINDKAQVIGIVFASTTVDVNGKSEPRALAFPIQVLSKPFLKYDHQEVPLSGWFDQLPNLFFKLTGV